MTGDVEIRPGIWLRYGCEIARLGPALRPRFSPLGVDAETRAFVSAALERPAGALRTRLFHTARRWLSDYDAYGLLGMYRMHLLSEGQARSLLHATQTRTLLDVGAGDGTVTRALAGAFSEVTTTETSRVLRAKLRRRGLAPLAIDLAETRLQRRFDVIACLNVIDRCMRPRSLLANALGALEPDGRMLLSVPLPLHPHVHVGRHTVDPEESLPRSYEVWELDATALADELLQPLGFQIERLCRAPYISAGDATTPLYVLDAALFVLRPAPAI